MSPGDLHPERKAFWRALRRMLATSFIFYHKSTLPAGRSSEKPPLCNIPVNDTDIGAGSRNKTCRSAPSDDQGDLAHISDFARHIRPVMTAIQFLLFVQEGIVRNKHFICISVRDGMSSVFNMKSLLFHFIFQAVILIFVPAVTKRRQTHPGLAISAFAVPWDPLDFRRDGIPDFAENVIFSNITCPRAFSIVSFQFLGRGVVYRFRLLASVHVADIVFGTPYSNRNGHFQIISLILINLILRFNSRSFPDPLLPGCQPVFPCLGLAEIIYIMVETVNRPYHSAFAPESEDVDNCRSIREKNID